jgi:alkylated DNA repair dioxygenase AlkB
VKTSLEKKLGVTFDYVLMNLYRSGYDKIGFHVDDEADTEGKNVIASISVGATREFRVKPRKGKEQIKLDLTHGSLVIMCGDMQKHYLHAVLEQPEIKDPRINLTFRIS